MNLFSKRKDFFIVGVPLALIGGVVGMFFLSGGFDGVRTRQGTVSYYLFFDSLIRKCPQPGRVGEAVFRTTIEDGEQRASMGVNFVSREDAGKVWGIITGYLVGKGFKLEKEYPPGTEIYRGPKSAVDLTVKPLPDGTTQVDVTEWTP